jgi:hypothetical protein
MEGRVGRARRVFEARRDLPGGKVLPIDMECVDAGYHTEAAQAYCAKRPRRLAVFGRAGWTLPILGRGEALKYGKQGKQGRAGVEARRRQGLSRRHLHREGELVRLPALDARLCRGDRRGREGVARPKGICHFSRDTPDDWFEHGDGRGDRRQDGQRHAAARVAGDAGPAEPLSRLPVYNMAAAEKLMLDTLSEADWARLRSERCAPKDPDQGDLLAAAWRAAGRLAARAQPMDRTEEGLAA